MPNSWALSTRRKSAWPGPRSGHVRCSRRRLSPQAQVDKDKQKEMQLKASTMQRGLERRCLTNSVDPGGL